MNPRKRSYAGADLLIWGGLLVFWLLALVIYLLVYNLWGIRLL